MHAIGMGRLTAARLFEIALEQILKELLGLEWLLMHRL